MIALRVVEPPPLGPWEPHRGGGLWRRRRLAVLDAWPATRGLDGRWYAYPDEQVPIVALPLESEDLRAAELRPPLMVVLPGRCLIAVTAASGWRVAGIGADLVLLPAPPAAAAA